MGQKSRARKSKREITAVKHGDLRLRAGWLSGQLFFRDSGAKLPDGRKIYGVCGVVAVPVNSQIKGEHQYAIMGRQMVKDQLMASIYLNMVNDLTETARGKTYDNLITSPLWRT